MLPSQTWFTDGAWFQIQNLGALSIFPLRHPEVRWWPAPAFGAAESVTKAPDLRVLLDAMLADQLEPRNLDLAAALAAEVDHLPAAEIVERGISPIDEGAGHQRTGRFG